MLLRHLNHGAARPLTCSLTQPPPGFPRFSPVSPRRGLAAFRIAPRRQHDGVCAIGGPRRRRTGPGHEHRPVSPDLDHRRTSRLPSTPGGHRPRVHLPHGFPRPQGCLWREPVGPGGGPGLVRPAPIRDRRSTRPSPTPPSQESPPPEQPGSELRPGSATPSPPTKRIKSYPPRRATMSAAREAARGRVGVVRVLEPNAKGYYRLKWTEPDGTRGDTSGRPGPRAGTREGRRDQRPW